MKIIVKESNLEKLDTAIRSAEGRATARTISASAVMKAAEMITKNLDIPKKHMIGITVLLDINAQDFPRAYKYTPESTHVNLLYTASGWAVTDITRDRTRGTKDAAVITLTDDAKTEILRNMSRMAAYQF